VVKLDHDTMLHATLVPRNVLKLPWICHRVLFDRVSRLLYGTNYHSVYVHAFMNQPCITPVPNSISAY